VPTLCVGTQGGDAPRRGCRLSWMGRGASERAFPRSAWERGEASLSSAQLMTFARSHMITSPCHFPRTVAQEDEQDQKTERRSKEPGVVLLVNRQGIFAILALRQTVDRIEVKISKRQGPRARRSVSTSRHLGDLAQRRFLQPGADKLAIVHQWTGVETNSAGRVGIADADGVNADAERDRDARSVPPFSIADGIVAVGQEQDVARAVKARIVASRGQGQSLSQPRTGLLAGPWLKVALLGDRFQVFQFRAEMVVIVCQRAR